MKPDPAFLRDFLEAVGRQRGELDPDFERHVILRLEAGAREYGDSYRQKTPAKLIREKREEAADIATWAALFTEILFDLDREHEIPPERAQHLRLKAIGWSAVAQYLWRDMTNELEEFGG